MDDVSEKIKQTMESMGFSDYLVYVSDGNEVGCLVNCKHEIFVQIIADIIKHINAATMDETETSG